LAKSSVNPFPKNLLQTVLHHSWSFIKDEMIIEDL